MRTYVVCILLLNACFVIAQDKEKCKRNPFSKLLGVKRVLSCKYRCQWTLTQYEHEDDGTPCFVKLVLPVHGVCYNGKCVEQLPHTTGEYTRVTGRTVTTEEWRTPEPRTREATTEQTKSFRKYSTELTSDYEEETASSFRTSKPYWATHGPSTTEEVSTEEEYTADDFAVRPVEYRSGRNQEGKLLRED
ncbi:uncharacterized protein LOC135373490 isoform X2 [Ornithodoros turicata]|uniref:uncharacterized protein LOC135373490 isoform X2 n=1 Tax=Ornithodoros turicata TaxID=34597 RepID=UPI0031394337